MAPILGFLFIVAIAAMVTAWAKIFRSPKTTRQLSLGGAPIKAVTKPIRGRSSENVWLNAFLSLFAFT